MNPVWKITLAEKGPLHPLTVNLMASDSEKAKADIRYCFPGREIVSVRRGSDPFARSEEIKAEYLNSGCEASDVDGAILRLMEECGELFEDQEAAYSFLMEYDSTDGAQESCDSAGLEFSAIQQIVANAYDGGDHFCKSPALIDTCGDGLLSFLMNELAVSEDCETLEEAISRINVAIRQLEAVRDGLEVASLDRTHLLKPWRVSLYEDNGDREFTMLFECQAEDAGHAEEQAKNAYPNCEIVNATEIEADEGSEA